MREGDGVAGHSEVHVTRTRGHLVTRDLGGETRPNVGRLKV